MNGMNETKDMKELINVGRNVGPGSQTPSADVTKPKCKSCGKDLINVGGLHYKCFNDNCDNFGKIVYINDI